MITRSSNKHWRVSRSWPVTIPLRWRSFARRARISPDGTTLWSLHEDRAVIDWDVASGEPTRVRLIDLDLQTYAFSNRGTLFGFDDKQQLWRLAPHSHAPERLFTRAFAAMAIRVSPDEQLLVLDHTAYHLGELVVVRRALGIWR